MALPVVDSITPDKTSYAPGALMTLTMKYHSANGQNVAGTFTGAVTDRVSLETGTGTCSFNVFVADPLDATGSDNQGTGRVWTTVSDDHVGTAVITAKA